MKRKLTQRIIVIFIIMFFLGIALLFLAGPLTTTTVTHPGSAMEGPGWTEKITDDNLILAFILTSVALIGVGGAGLIVFMNRLIKETPEEKKEKNKKDVASTEEAPSD